MPVTINTTVADFEYAERLLLPPGGVFDAERRAFISNFNTLDLQAVPGSGKTTALLAKLLIIERRLPFPDGSGILVISHTNAAIDEIKRKIGKQCQMIFSYPNHIGTIQSFVDKYLAIPFYHNICKGKLQRIDNEIYDDTVEAFYNAQPYCKAKAWLNNRQTDAVPYLKKLRFDVNYNLLAGIGGKIVLKSASATSTYNTLAKMKLNILKKGILHFDDAYFLAELYIKTYPKVRELLLKRFHFVFVDERQDMDKHQYDLLENLFYNNNQGVSAYQRIGDKNQAIYSYDVKLDDIWVDRETVLALNNSHRLSKPIGDLVNYLAIYRKEGFNINGLQKCDIKPHLIIYEDSTIKNVLSAFSNIVHNLINSHKIPNEGLSVKAIAWNSVWNNDDAKDNDSKVRLVDYHADFRKEHHRRPIDHECLNNYLIYFDRSNGSMDCAQKNIYNAFLRLLRLEDISDNETGRYHTKQSLVNHFKENNQDFYDRFKLNIFKWSLLLIKNKPEQAFAEIKLFVPMLLNIFGKTIDKSDEFTNQIAESGIGKQIDAKCNSNIVNYHGFDITTIPH